MYWKALEAMMIIYTLDNKEEYKNPANYRKSNPAVGYTITEGVTECRWYSGSTTISLSAEGRGYIKTQTKGVDVDFGRLYRLGDLGSAGTTGIYYCAELIGIDANGNRQPFPHKTKFILDNVA